MKRYRIQVKTSKKQWIYLIIELVALIILPIIPLGFSASDLAIIITLIISFSVAITMMVLTLKENIKLYKEQKNELIRQAKIRIIDNFVTKQNNFDYMSDDKIKKKNYVVCTLLTACSLNDMSYFYMYTSDFDINEIVDILLGYDVTDDFKDFVLNVIKLKGLTKSALMFESEVADIVMMLAKIKDKRDEKFFDSEIFYDKTKHFRCYALYNENKKCYNTFCETYKEYLWNKDLNKKTYEKKEIALSDLKSYINGVNKITELENMSEITYISEQEEKWYKLLYLYSKGDKWLDKDYYNLMDYYIMVSADGHKEYLYFKDITRYKYMDIVLPAELYDNLIKIELYTGEERDNAIKNLDKCFEKYDNQLRENLVNFIKITE